MCRDSAPERREWFGNLESRQLLAPTISAFYPQTGTLAQHEGEVVYILAEAPEGIRDVTIFVDMDRNGVWTAGADIDLGRASYSPGSQRYSKYISPSANWPRDTILCADAVGTTGEWCASPVSFHLTIDAEPVLSGMQLSASVAVPGDQLLMSVHGTDDTSIARTLFFLDRNANNLFDPAIESILGNVYVPDDQGDFSLSVAVGADWPVNSRIVADAMDSDGRWTLSRPWMQVSVSNGDVAPPDIGTTSLSVLRNARGEPFLRLGETATDQTGIRATTYFLDLDENGVWTDTVDISLETFWAEGNTAVTRTSDIRSDLAGKRDVAVYVDAQDTNLRWHGAVLVGIARQPPAPQVTAFYVEETSANVLRLTADGYSPGQYGAADGDLGSVEFFIDNDSNRVFSNGDLLLGRQTDFTDIPGGQRRFVLTADLTSTAWNRSRKFAAVGSATPDQAGGEPRSQIRLAVLRGTVGSVPTILSIHAEIGLDPVNHTVGVPVPGTVARVTVSWEAPLGGRAVTFFYDQNGDGIWNDHDVDLGAQFISGTSGTFTFYTAPIENNSGWGYTHAYLGYGSIAAAVKDLSIRGNDNWGPPRTEGVSQIREGPYPSTFDAARHGNEAVLTARLIDAFAVRGITGFIDLNRNGIFDSSDKDATSSRRVDLGVNGIVWQLTFDITGMTSNILAVIWRGFNFYRGDPSQPGGTSNGVFGPQVNYYL